MSLLLDTHALLWYVLTDPRLPASTRNTIDTEPADVFASPASLWEIAIKISNGKYRLEEPFEAFWSEMFETSKLQLLPISIRHTARVIELPHLHRDPFDRLIIAQGLAEDIPVVSVDAMFDSYGVRRIW